MADTMLNHTLMVSCDTCTASWLVAESVLSDAVVCSTETLPPPVLPLLKDVNPGLVTMTASAEEVLDSWPPPVGCDDPPTWSSAVTTLRPLWTLQELLGPGWEKVAIGSFQPIWVSSHLNLARVVIVGLFDNLLLLLGAVLALKSSKHKDRYEWQGLSAMLGALLMLQVMAWLLPAVEAFQSSPGSMEYHQFVSVST